MKKRNLKNNVHNQKKSHHILLWSMAIIIILFVGSGLTIYSNAKDTTQKTYEAGPKHKARNVNATVKQNKPLSILLMGTDTGALGRHDTGRTDTMMVVTINPKNKTTHITSIPRDTKVSIPGDSQPYEKINAAYEIGGPAQAVSSVQHLLNIPIDYYALVNMGGLEQMVNAVGNVTVTPSLSFNYEGNSFVKGQKQTLNGQQALSYSRMRYDDPEGDYGRQKRQQEVLKDIAMKGLKLSSIPRYHSILNSLSNNLKTDITFNNMLKIGSRYKDVTNNVQTDALQGHGAMLNGLSYQIPTNDEINIVSNEIKHNLDIDNNTSININENNNTSNK